MSNTYKDKRGYLNGIKRKKELLSTKYLRHRNQDDCDRGYSESSSDLVRPYKCVERKPALYLTDFDDFESLVDELDSITDKTNAA